MSLLKAFERNMGRSSGFRSVRIVPQNKPTMIGLPQVEVSPEAIREMVSDSQAVLLMDEVARLRGIISNTQAQMLNLLVKFDQYKTLTEKLAEETGKMAEVRSLCKQHGDKGIYVRDAKSVAKRWDGWRKLYEQGMTEGEIAVRYGVAHETVIYAKNKGWVNTRRGRPAQWETKQPTKGNNQ